MSAGVSIMDLFVLREAVASVALSHPKNHECDVCKAAAGDYEAFIRIAADRFFPSPPSPAGTP